ncbi:hypothetical protein [Tengunoibacter tsumagoiensis]|uniref:hypothetical protein n=1 Tax=Tengunoibacter tsumagoiensis TaxID=2014871 RepID=UPI000F83B704|nr:hypothetical protein [Tengunoibacter tsumagoiensis]
MKKVEHKRAALVANLGDLHRPLRVRPVRYLAREWWAIDTEDIWPGIVMDLRRLGFEATAMGEEVLVREGSPAYEPQLEGPNAEKGLKAFPTLHPTIQIRKESPKYSYWDDYAFEEIEDEEEDEEEDELEPEDLEADLY